MSIYQRLEHDWHTAEQRAASWFQPHHPHSPTIALDNPPAQGATMSLKTLADDIKTALEDAETKTRTILDQHMPQLTAMAEAVESDPLIQAVEAAVLPPGARAVIADMVTKLASEFAPPAAPEVAAAPEPAPQPV
jgi:hypothetical protein